MHKAQTLQWQPLLEMLDIFLRSVQSTGLSAIGCGQREELHREVLNAFIFDP